MVGNPMDIIFPPKPDSISGIPHRPRVITAAIITVDRKTFDTWLYSKSNPKFPNLRQKRKLIRTLAEMKAMDVATGKEYTPKNLYRPSDNPAFRPDKKS